jgi:hypothetical protein
MKTISKYIIGSFLVAQCVTAQTIPNASFDEPQIKPPLRFITPGSPGFAEAQTQLQWTFGVRAGICVEGTHFAEGIKAAKGRQVAFVQGETPEELINVPPPRSLFGVDLTGLRVGEEYEVSWQQTGRATDIGSGAVSVVIGDGVTPGQPLLYREPVTTKGEWQRQSVTFRATATKMRLNFRHFIHEPGNPDFGTEVTLFDDFSIRSTQSR